MRPIYTSMFKSLDPNEIVGVFQWLCRTGETSSKDIKGIIANCGAEFEMRIRQNRADPRHMMYAAVVAEK